MRGASMSTSGFEDFMSVLVVLDEFRFSNLKKLESRFILLSERFLYRYKLSNIQEFFR